MSHDVVVIVGAPRSGTNVLRDALCAIDGFSTWPCDEINLLWKHGNRSHPSDELEPADARPDVVAFLRRRFDAIGDRPGVHTVVEKTCATSLRVAFAATCFPEARFVFIQRDGIDVAASTIQRWNAPLDLAYTARKLRYVPVGDLPYYGRRFLAGRLRREGGAAGAAEGWWGPRPHDFREILRDHPLDEVAMIQWSRCVESAIADLEQLPAQRVHRITYERFVVEPAARLGAILEFLGRPADVPPAAVAPVSASSVGKGRHSLPAETVDRLEALVQPTLLKLGYEGGSAEVTS